MLKDINKIPFFALVICPLLIIGLAIHYGLTYGIGMFEILLVIVSYYLCNITVGIGLHRLWSHDAYKTNKYVEFVLAILAAWTLQGPILAWASNHFDHHTYTDTDKDPHSPLKYSGGIKGFLWAHFVWMLVGEESYRMVNKVTMVKLGKNKILTWQMKNYLLLATLTNTLFPILIGYFLGGQTLGAAYAGLVFIGLGRAIQQQMTFCVNSLCHYVGTHKYVKGTAGDIWWMAIFLLGENWHNYHHAFPSDYRNGAKWYQADVHKWIIYLMSKIGLAWDLNRTDGNRIEAKVHLTLEQFVAEKKEQLSLIKQKLEYMMSDISAKLPEIEDASAQVKEKISSSYNRLYNNLVSLMQQVNQQLSEIENPSDKIIALISKNVRDAETKLRKLYSSNSKKKA